MHAKILIIAEAANPNWVSVPLLGWSLARTLSKTLSAHIITHVRNRNAFLDAGLREGTDFTAIDSDVVARPLWQAANILRGKSGVGWTTNTAFSALAYYYFESLVWGRFGAAIRNHEYDIVHRVTPLSPTIPSTIAIRCKRAGVPFIIGPLNGGVPWPTGFHDARHKEREWLSYIRSAYRLLPGYKNTLESAAVIIAGSKDTLQQIPLKYHEKCIYLPENAVNPERFSLSAASATHSHLRACFVGRLVPYKGPDMLLEAAAPFLKSDRLRLDIVGDGPMMPTLRKFLDDHGISRNVTLHGWVKHAQVQDIMCQSQLFIFPSIREFGGGVILEAMALGLVPVVVNYAGPGELVTDDTGYRIPIGARKDVVLGLQECIHAIINKPQLIEPMSRRAKIRVNSLFTWEAKAKQMTEVYRWVLSKKGNKPSFFRI